jgi:hypothetical protein
VVLDVLPPVVLDVLPVELPIVFPDDVSGLVVVVGVLSGTLIGGVVFVVVEGGTVGAGAGLLLHAPDNNRRKISIENRETFLISILLSVFIYSYYITCSKNIKDINVNFSSI